MLLVVWPKKPAGHADKHWSGFVTSPLGPGVAGVPLVVVVATVAAPVVLVRNKKDGLAQLGQV